MNTALLRYAVEYAACGSAQKTAARLGVNRSSVTRNIKRLEEELGAQLFITTGDGPVPTNFGEICLRYAREILKEEENLRFDGGYLHRAFEPASGLRRHQPAGPEPGHRL